MDQLKLAEILGSNTISNSQGTMLVCTPERPMPVDHQGRWLHTQAKEIRDYGNSVRIKCETCGIEWTEELAE